MKNINSMNRILQVLNIIFSSLLIALALPNDFYSFGSPVIGFLALIPFYEVYSKQKSYIGSALSFALLTFLTQLFSSYWLGMFKEFAFVTLFFTCFGTSIEGFCMGLFLHLPFAKTGKTMILRSEKNPLYSSFIPMKIFWFTLIYVTYEWIKSAGFLGYPWGTLSMSMYKFPVFIQIADITGTYGITFLTVLASALLYEYWIFYIENLPFKNYFRAPDFKTYAKDNFRFITLRRVSLVFLSLFSLTVLYGVFQYYRKRPVKKYMNTVIVQQNQDPWAVSNDNDTIRLSQKLTLEQIEKAREMNEPVNLVVWSEGCLKYSFPSSAHHYKNYPREEPLTQFIKKLEVPFILGGSYIINDRPRQAVNATLLFDEKGNFRGYYGKLHLVPFAEVIPFADNPKFASFLNNKLGISSGWHPGLQYVYYDIKGEEPEEKIIPQINVISLKDTLEQQKKKENEKPFIRVSTPICYDDAFPDVCTPLLKNGSELLVNLTDDSWSNREVSEYQHFVVSSFRAVELRTTLARSTNSGYSAVIGPNGKVLYDLPLFEETSGFFKIPVFDHKITTYARLGNWLPHLSAILILSVCVLQWLYRNSEIEVSSERKKFKKEKKLKKAKKEKNSKKRR